MRLSLSYSNAWQHEYSANNTDIVANMLNLTRQLKKKNAAQHRLRISELGTVNAQ